MPYVNQDEWKAVSETFQSKGGWELVGGALRRDSSAEAIRVRLHEAGVSVRLRLYVSVETPRIWSDGSFGDDHLWHYASTGGRHFFEIYETRPESSNDPIFYYEEVAEFFGAIGAAQELQALRFIEKAVEAYTALRVTA